MNTTHRPKGPYWGRVASVADELTERDSRTIHCSWGPRNSIFKDRGIHLIICATVARLKRRLPMARALCSSAAVICPERSVSTARNHCKHWKDTRHEHRWTKKQKSRSAPPRVPTTVVSTVQNTVRSCPTGGADLFEVRHPTSQDGLLVVVSHSGASPVATDREGKKRAQRIVCCVLWTVGSNYSVAFRSQGYRRRHLEVPRVVQVDWWSWVMCVHMFCAFVDHLKTCSVCQENWAGSSPAPSDVWEEELLYSSDIWSSEECSASLWRQEEERELNVVEWNHAVHLVGVIRLSPESDPLTEKSPVRTDVSWWIGTEPMLNLSDKEWRLQTATSKEGPPHLTRKTGASDKTEWENSNAMCPRMSFVFSSSPSNVRILLFSQNSASHFVRIGVLLAEISQTHEVTNKYHVCSGTTRTSTLAFAKINITLSSPHHRGRNRMCKSNVGLKELQKNDNNADVCDGEKWLNFMRYDKET